MPIYSYMQFNIKIQIYFIYNININKIDLDHLFIYQSTYLPIHLIIYCGENRCSTQGEICMTGLLWMSMWPWRKVCEYLKREKLSKYIRSIFCQGGQPQEGGELMWVRQAGTLLVKAGSGNRGGVGQMPWMLGRQTGAQNRAAFRIKTSYCWVGFLHLLLPFLPKE